MKVLLTADAYIPDWYSPLPARLITDARRSDLILLAGDVVSTEVTDTLKACAPVEAVHGNFCNDDLKEKIPAKKVLSLAGRKVGLTHGHLGNGRDTDEKSLSLFDEPLGVLVHGHTHHYHQRKMEDAGDRTRFAPRYKVHFEDVRSPDTCRYHKPGVCGSVMECSRSSTNKGTIGQTSGSTTPTEDRQSAI